MSARSASFADLPSYVVSAPHMIRTGTGADVRVEPFGIQHAREGTSPLTACGEWAVEWRLFWNLEFPSSPTDTCRKCMRLVSALRHEQSSLMESHLV